MPTILIVGGYGAVGSKIAATLAAVPTNSVIIAGRNLDKAQAKASELKTEARHIDIAGPQSWPEAISGVNLVIMCIDQTSTELLAAISARGIAYLDVTAGDAFFRQAEAMQLTTPALLSVGLAPGLSNLLAASASANMDQVTSIEIGLLMGTGDEHGSAAIKWSTGQMFDPKAPHDDAIVDFGPDFGRRMAHFMDFADQHALARTMPGVATVTRVTYDSRFLSSVLFGLGRRFAGNRWMENLVERISHLPTLGSDKCVLSVTAHGSVDGKAVTRTAWFLGRREAAVTAAVAALMAEQMLAGHVPAGVHHGHQVINAAAVFAGLSQHGRFILP